MFFAIFICIFNVETAHAQDSTKSDEEGQTHTVEFEGTLRLDHDYIPNENGDLKLNLRTQKFEMQASVKIPHLFSEKIAKEILFIIRSKMEQDIFVNGILKANHLTAVDYLKEAYVEFKKVGGLPIAVIVGTMEVSYGQDFLNLTSPGGIIFTSLQEFHSFNKIETMLSIRDSRNEWEEDGIWHDDGSRVFAFSISLSLHSNEIVGGLLELRRKNESHIESIPTPDFGTAILFLTGTHGFEHRTRRVTHGKRIMLVGWCS